MVAIQAIVLLVLRIVAFPGIFRLVEFLSMLAVLGWWRWGRAFAEQVGLCLLALALAWGIPITIIAIFMDVFYW